VVPIYLNCLETANTLNINAWNNKIWYAALPVLLATTTTKICDCPSCDHAKLLNEEPLQVPEHEYEESNEQV